MQCQRDHATIYFSIYRNIEIKQSGPRTKPHSNKQIAPICFQSVGSWQCKTEYDIPGMMYVVIVPPVAPMKANTTPRSVVEIEMIKVTTRINT